MVTLPSWEISSRGTSQNPEPLCLLEIVRLSELKVIFSSLALPNLNVASEVVISMAMGEAGALTDLSHKRREWGQELLDQFSLF